MHDQRGAASVEWTGLVLVVALTLGALGGFVPAVDGRSLGAAIVHALVCAVEGGCSDGDVRLADAYGERDAALVRAHAPSLVYERGERQLPVDYRHCRAARCAEAPDDPALDVHRTTRGGHPATAFTRLVHRGGETYVQYWLYYPDSNSAVLGSDRLWPHAGLAVQLAGRLLTGSWAYPGYHRDDWESYQVRVDRGGAAVRASSHGSYQWCKQSRCKDLWGPETGWTRVSRGSHAGHIPLDSDLESVELEPRLPLLRVRFDHSYRPLYPGAGLAERSTTAPGLRLIPLETLARGRYRRLDPGITPPWEKDVYRDPRSGSTG